jgi:hypothetical protein
VYVAWVALFSTLAGLIYGSWVDGANVATLILFLGLFLSALALALFLVNRRNLRQVQSLSANPR